MFIQVKVIYDDGTTDIVDSAKIVELMRTKKVVAIQCSEGWLEIRRDQIIGFTPEYKGQEKRKTRL
jgi:hypothetical protein